MLDIFGFRKIYFILLITELVIIVTIEYIASNKALFCIWVIFSMACEGGHFVLFPSKTIEYMIYCILESMDFNMELTYTLMFIMPSAVLI